jgi:hypothetical protein
MSKCIRLLDSTRETVIDSIDVEYEDSFCLESFGDLAQAFYDYEDDKRSQGTSGFIIARCQTWDHKQPGKMFWSYYNAFHLNKILFQTQVYLGRKLIHRLHVLNPLTNTDIIGNIQYFKVGKKQSLAVPIPGITVIAEEGEIEMTPASSPDSKQQGSLRIDTESPKKSRVSRGQQSATVREIETGVSQKWTLASSSVAVDNDDVDARPSSARKGKKMSLKGRMSTSSENPDNEAVSEDVFIPFTPLTAPPGMIPPPIAIHIGNPRI